MTLSLGKLRGLQSTSTADGVFTILALDHGASFLRAMRPGAPDSATAGEAVSVKLALVRALAPHASAVLLDAVYGLAPAVASGALPGNVGLLAAVEDGDYASAGTRGRLLADWSVAKIKHVGASAVKLFFYYNPDDADAQDSWVSGVVADCRRCDLPLFAEPIVLGGADRRQAVVESARRIGRLGVDVLKMEFPVDVRREQHEPAWLAACEALSAASPAPWVLLSAGVDFETFARQLQAACRAGASGYVAGRTIWQEAASLIGEAQSSFIQQVAVPRMRRLADIVHAHARPWTDFYPPTETVAENWYAHYPARRGDDAA